MRENDRSIQRHRRWARSVNFHRGPLTIAALHPVLLVQSGTRRDSAKKYQPRPKLSFPMPADETFRLLMDRLRSGEDSAAQVIFERFARQLIAMTRQQFDHRIAHKVDAEDVVQSAYKSFFVRHQAGKVTVENWNSLWKLLTLITMRKCADRVEYLKADRRDIGREAPQTRDADQAGPWQLAMDREPLPEETAMLAETLEDLFRTVDEHERPILELSLQGFTVPEISQQLGRAERSVRRLRERIRKRLERQQAVD